MLPEFQTVTISPDVADVRYGPHERHVLDLYLAKSDRPTALVVHMHGGGFALGDKREDLNANLLMPCLVEGISVASINYRYSTQASAPGPFVDAVSAVEFLRVNAGRWNLDPSRFAGAGSSAGAGLALLLAFRDGLFKCVYVTGAQCSYDPRWIRANIPGDAWRFWALAKLFSLEPGEDENPPAEKAKLMEDLAPINHVKADSPPVYLWYRQSRSLPSDAAATIHHPKFGDLLKAKMDGFGIESVLKVAVPPVDPTPVAFLKKYLC